MLVNVRIYIQEAKTLMKKMITEAEECLGKITKKIGKKCIEKATEYFELYKELQKVEYLLISQLLSAFYYCI